MRVKSTPQLENYSRRDEKNLGLANDQLLMLLCERVKDTKESAVGHEVEAIVGMGDTLRIARDMKQAEVA